MGRKREEKKEAGRREEEENPGLELLFGTSLLYGTYVWICWLGNYHNSFFLYV